MACRRWTSWRRWWGRIARTVWSASNRAALSSASPLAVQLGVGFGMVRKRGKLPGSVVSHAYSLEYGMDSIEISADLIDPGSRVVVIDDLIATGGTAAATVELLRKIGAEPVAAVFLIELTFLNGRAKLDVPVETLLQYDS